MRQRDTHPNGDLLANWRFCAQDPWRGLPQVGARPHQQLQHAGLDSSNQILPGQTPGFFRPPAPHRQLYNPDGLSCSGQSNRFLAQSNRASVQAQVDYLDTLAFEQIPKVEISHEEFAEKQALRSSLEQVCRKTVSDWEIAHKDPNFEADNVELKCFGSLSTTFATKSSDMDLIIVSPSSRPSPSAPESELPRTIEKALLDMGYGARLLTRTRVPIIRFCEKPNPELANSLLAERSKWEKERGKPPKAPKRKEKKKSEMVKEDELNPTLPHNRLGNLPEKDGHLHGTIPNHDDEPPKEPAPVTSNVQSDNTTLSDNAALSDKKTDGRGGNPPPPMEKEGTNPSLLAISEGELTRLYRLAMLEGWYEPAERQVINTFIQAVERNDTRKDVKAMARSRLQELPNVLARYRAPPEAHHLEFPKTGVGIQCDINFSNHLALHNSHLLKCYSLCDSRVRRMVLFVKAWSKKRKINTPYHGTLSSYGYVLMVLHYLVNIANPPVVPNLQRMPQAFQDELSSKEISYEGHDIRFFRNEKAIEELRRRKEITVNEESVGSLLRGFFHYFAQQGYTSPGGGFHWTLDTLSLRTIGGILPKQTKGWTGAKTERVEMAGPGATQTKEVRQRYLFAIEDPFEIEHNIARTVVHNGIVAIRDEFRRAHRLIENAGYDRGKGLEDLFAEAEDKENLQYRAFGPRPRGQGAAIGAGKKADEQRNGGNERFAPTTAASSVGQNVTF
ncbi:hypothetical protein N7G274_008535 [Stereocaulon virgatum]|uniref:polynucleotide adenylyltransferase n=1 Tax=Stereocaulon virgatum TaxID=373712 RepID=A0ABR4A313_9LECA